MPNQEAQARRTVDRALQECGWLVQRYKFFDPPVARRIALIEAPFKVSITDCVLLSAPSLGCGEASKSSPATHPRQVLELLVKRSGMLDVIFRKAQNKILDSAK